MIGATGGVDCVAIALQFGTYVAALAIPHGAQYFAKQEGEWVGRFLLFCPADPHPLAELAKNCMMICHEGLDGSGKTYSMAEDALRNIALGRDCFGTFQVVGMRPIVDARQMIKMENARLYFDEWHQDNDAKAWWNLDPIIRHMVSQHRHYKLVIHYSTQSFFYMVRYIRLETSFVWQHEALFRDPDTGESKPPWPFHKMHRHRKTRYFAQEFELKKRHPEILERKAYWMKKEVFEKFDSYKKIILTSKHISDEELEKIKDPYQTPVITDLHGAPAHLVRRDISKIGDLAPVEDEELPEDIQIGMAPDLTESA